MFVGRKKELQSLERMFASDKFEFFVIYGQRRIGKTTLISEFIKDKKVIFMTAKEVNDHLNLTEFTRKIENAFELRTDTLHFNTWENAFVYLSDSAKEDKLLVVIDEYPYAAIANKSLNSMLQIAIDHHLKNTKIKLILSGSHVSFMEDKVMGSKSPLYGRRTGMIQLKPFDYYDSGKMLPSFSSEDKVKFYSVLDGIPYYLSLVDARSSFEENISRMFFETDGALFNEPDLLIKQEFDTPARYNSIIEAVAKGAQKSSQIEQITGIEKSPASAYIRTLTDIGFLAKEIPFGENPLKSRKGKYTLGNNMLRFWFTNVSPHFSDIQLGNGNIIFNERVLPMIDDYIGKSAFETVCLSYLLRLNSQSKLPFLASKSGKWWGNDPVKRGQTDVDVIVSDPNYSNSIILGECKWRTDIKEILEIEKLQSKSILFPEYALHYYFFFFKGSFATQTRKHFAKTKNLTLLELDDLFDMNYE